MVAIGFGLAQVVLGKCEAIYKFSTTYEIGNENPVNVPKPKTPKIKKAIHKSGKLFIGLTTKPGAFAPKQHNYLEGDSLNKEPHFEVSFLGKKALCSQSASCFSRSGRDSNPRPPP
jgi:hypothetical protein